MAIDDEKLQNLIGFRLHPKQKEILNCKEREIIVCAGRRFGKSLLASYIALKELLDYGKRIWIVAPNYDLTQIIFDNIVTWLFKISPSGKTVEIKKRPVPQIITARNSILECKSAENPVSLLGRSTNLIIVDEAARVPESIWNQYLFPTTHDRTGRAIFISTPFGQNWFYQKFLELKEKKSAFHFTSQDNPYFGKEELERARKSLPERVFLQEYLASFLPEAASLFRGVDEIVSEDCLEEPKPGHFYILGVDLGRYEDFTVLTVVDRETNKVVYFERFQKIDFPFQKTRIISVSRKYNLAKIIIDSTTLGSPIAEDLKREGMIVEDYTFSGQSKIKLIEKLMIFIEQKAITIPPIPELIEELKVYSYELSERGNVTYSAPKGFKDDCVISLALAVWGLTSPIKREVVLERSQPLVKRKFEYF